MSGSWYRNAIVYALDVETFYDSNGDGCGDFPGLTEKLGYLAGLGINCLWILPFFPSPGHDDGYDVSDYFNVDPRLGDLGDFAAFMHAAEQHNIRVIIDLVVNHTSISHPWFREARKSPDSPYRNYYVWSDKPVHFEHEELMLKGEEDTMWTYDEVAGQYYRHRFYKEQPDLNIANPDVRKEIMNIMGFWIRMGVSGFRIDATEILIEHYGIAEEEREGTEKILNEMREFIEEVRSDAILLAETNVHLQETRIYVEGRSKVHLLFNFYLNQHLFLSLADRSAAPLAASLREIAALDMPASTWLNFLRHHDELSLRLLSDAERERTLKEFAPVPEMRQFRHGIRRRLASLLKNNEALMKTAFSLLFSFPGIPLIRYGDEIGMWDNLQLPGRKSVRTPMQWNDAKNGGFSTAAPSKLVMPVIDGPHGYTAVNVDGSGSRPGGLTEHVRKLSALRKHYSEFFALKPDVHGTSSHEILVHRFRKARCSLVFIHNLGANDIQMKNSEAGLSGDVLDLFSGEKATEMVIPAFGFKWLKEML